jgi:hypothetical protein
LTRISPTVPPGTHHNLFNEFTEQRIAKVVRFGRHVDLQQNIGYFSRLGRFAKANDRGRRSVFWKRWVKIQFLQWRGRGCRQLDQHNIIHIGRVAVFGVGKFFIHIEKG